MVQLECNNGVDNNEIKDIHKLLQKCIGKNHPIVKIETKRLTAAGENYGSVMLAVDAYIKNYDNMKDQILHAVAKLAPPNEWLKELFSTSITFKKEIGFYNSIVPAMKEFQIEQGVKNVIDCFPECYGARISLDPDSTIVDDNAVLILENLKFSKFEVVDRMKGFNLETTKMILKDLAAFHAIPIAIKLLKPEVFNKKILPHLDKNTKFDTLSEAAEKGIIDSVLKIIETKKECIPFLADIKRSLQLCLNNFKNSATLREPFATINHNDFWVNNTMVKIHNGKPVKNKMLDFQLIDYGSPGNDIVFLLFSSVQKEVLDEHYDELIKLYYDRFIHILKELNCDTTKFTFEKLQEEIQTSAKTRQFFHVLVMLKHILAIKDKVKELSEMTEEDIISEVQISDEYREKVPEIAYEFIKRKWIYS